MNPEINKISVGLLDRTVEPETLGPGDERHTSARCANQTGNEGNKHTFHVSMILEPSCYQENVLCRSA